MTRIKNDGYSGRTSLTMPLELIERINHARREGEGKIVSMSAWIADACREKLTRSKDKLTQRQP